jgi:Tfp pilus assembly protein PilF
MISRTRAFLIVLVGLLLGVLLILEISIPFRQKIAERHVERGDVYLVAQDFDQAALEYRQALSYDSSNQPAIQKEKLARKGGTDIAVLKDFYEEHFVTAVLSNLAIAQKEYEKPKESLEAGVSFYEKGEYVYARYPLERAVRLDPEYPEAWHYLGLTYQELSKEDSSYSQKAAEALEKRDQLTPRYLKD